jgi:hypothetical protein
MLPSLLLASAVVEAASYDPELTWRTLSTEHFNITFHGGLEPIAEEMADIAEDVYAEMTVELAWEPRRKTEVVLVDNTDSANGYAMTLPVNTIVIFVTAPEAGSTLSLYEDWNHAILTHEYVHILHLDTIEGLPRLLRAVMGRIISINQVSPGWIVEGQATFQETRKTTGGRGRSPYVDMIKRVTVLADRFPPLGNMDGWQIDPPGGNLRYLFGQDFMQYISDQTGEMVWTDWNHTYGGSIPYLLPARKVFGERLVPLYNDWKAHLIEKYAAQKAAIEAEGLTPFTLLSDGEDYCGGATFSPDGERLVWSCSDPATGPNIFLARGDGSRPEIEVEGAYADDFSWRADSAAFAYSSRRVVNRFNLYTDVYLHSLSGRTEALTSGDRARNPTFTTDGERLLVVTNEAQSNQLARLTVDRRTEVLTEHTDHTQYSSPRYSPDGRHIAVSVWQEGYQDLWLLDADGGPVRRLTADLAADIDPRWSADGRTLYFSSDRTGVYNIYAVDLQTERLYQVTNVIGGAFRPSPSPAEDALAFEYYDVNGSNVALMPLSREDWRDRGLLPLPLTARAPLAEALPQIPIARPQPPAFSETEPEAEDAPRKKRARGTGAPGQLTETYHFPGITGIGGPMMALSGLPGPWGLPGESGPAAPDQPNPEPDTDQQDTIDTEAPEEEDYAFSHPVGRYNPLPTLPPRYIAPAIYQTAFGFQGLLATGGTDTLRRYFYSAYVSYRTDSRFTGWGVSAAVNKWIPVITAGAYTFTVPYGDLYLYPGEPSEGGSWVPGVESANVRYWDKRLQSYVQVSYPTSSYRTVFGRWTGSYRTHWFVPSEESGISRGEPLPENAYRPFLPTRGFLSQLGGGWRFARGKYFNQSISPEDARIVYLVGSVSSPWIGSYTLNDEDQAEGFTQVLLSGEWREYITVPWPADWQRARNHVAAFKLAAGSSLGDSQRYGSYRLGGSFGDSATSTLPDEWRALRGFPSASVYGDWYYLGSAEYRLPLWWVDRGVGTIPAFARYLSGAVFLDAGLAFDDPATIDPGQTLVGTGAELRGSVILGWGIPITGRLGYAFALNGSGYSLGSLSGAYAWLGTSF